MGSFRTSAACPERPNTRVSRMQLDHVAVLHRMLTPHLLSVESGRTPHPRVPERAREVFVHEPRDVLHGLAAVEYERPSPVWRAARRLGVDAGDAKMTEQPGADFPETLPSGCGHGEGRITTLLVTSKKARSSASASARPSTLFATSSV